MFSRMPVLWFVDPDGDWSGLASHRAEAVFALAMFEWSQVCGISFLRTWTPADARLVLTCGEVDGRGGVFAHSNFAGDDELRAVRIKLDRAENWCYQETPADGFVDLGRVLIHEVGHAIGIRDHGPDGGAMCGTYEAATRRLDEWCVREARFLYGEPEIVEVT